jgi:hypothetical protein
MTDLIIVGLVSSVLCLGAGLLCRKYPTKYYVYYMWCYLNGHVSYGWSLDADLTRDGYYCQRVAECKTRDAAEKFVSDLNDLEAEDD